MSASKVVFKIVSISFSILIVILIVTGLYQGGQMAYDFGYRIFAEEAVASLENGEDKVVQVTSGMGAMELSELLEKKGLIRDARVFFLQLKLTSDFEKIKEGNYTLSTSMTAREMLQVMSAEEVEAMETEE